VKRGGGGGGGGSADSRGEEGRGEEVSEERRWEGGIEDTEVEVEEACWIICGGEGREVIVDAVC
jgi:hypothetical protein